MERIERTARIEAVARPRATRAYAQPQFSAEAEPDVPSWDVQAVPPATIDRLRGEVEALRERLAHAAPKRAVVEMDKAITLLCRRVEDIREAGEGDALAKAILAMAANLSLDTVAEGIETPVQAERLRALGCRLGQGYLFAPALPAEAIPAMFERDAVTYAR